MKMELFIKLNSIEELCENINLSNYGQIIDSLVAIVPLLNVVKPEQENTTQDRLIEIRRKIHNFLLSKAINEEQRDYYVGIIEGIYKIMAYILA